VLQRLFHPFSKLLAFLGPGLFLIGYNIGTGSVTTMASAGSRWGMSLTWTVALSCLFTFVGIWAFTRYTLVTQDTILYAIKKRFPWGKQISLFIMGAVIVAEFAGITGLMAIIVDLLQEWIKYAAGYDSLSIKVTLTVLLAGLLFVTLWKGQYQFLENVLSILVAIMGVSFLATVFLVVPSWKTIVTGLIPKVPNESNATLVVAGMAGTTFSSAILYCRSITLKAKRWKLDRERNALTDSIVSAVVMFALSIAVMICAAGTLYVMNKPVEEAVDMVRTLEPLAGQFAITLFIIGVIGAGVSSLIPTILIAPWLISDYRNTDIDPTSKYSRIFVLIGVFVALIGPFLKTKPVILMIVTMALLSVILPLSTIAIFVLLNQKHLGKNKNSLPMNVACVGAIAFSLIMAYYGVVGLLGYFGNANP